MKKRILSVVLLICVALAAVGCDNVQSDNEAAAEPSYDDIIVAEVNGQDVTMGDFNYVYTQNAAYVGAQLMLMGVEDWENEPYNGPDEEYQGKTYGQAVKEACLETFYETIVIQQRAKEYDIVLDDERIEETDAQKQEFVEQLAAYNGGVSIYDQYLDSFLSTDYTVEKLLQRESLRKDLMLALSEKGQPCEIDESITDEDQRVELAYRKFIDGVVQDWIDKSSIKVYDDVLDEAIAKERDRINEMIQNSVMQMLYQSYGY